MCVHVFKITNCATHSISLADTMGYMKLRVLEKKNGPVKCDGNAFGVSHASLDHSVFFPFDGFFLGLFFVSCILRGCEYMTECVVPLYICVYLSAIFGCLYDSVVGCFAFVCKMI